MHQRRALAFRSAESVPQQAACQCGRGMRRCCRYHLRCLGFARSTFKMICELHRLPTAIRPSSRSTLVIAPVHNTTGFRARAAFRTLSTGSHRRCLLRSGSVAPTASAALFLCSPMGWLGSRQHRRPQQPRRSRRAVRSATWYARLTLRRLPAACAAPPATPPCVSERCRAPERPLTMKH